MKPIYSPYLKLRHRVLRVKPNCFYCGDPAISADHKIPIIKGGTNNLCNLVSACNQCNREKGDLDFNLFCRFIRRFGKPPVGWRTKTNHDTLRTMNAILVRTVNRWSWEMIEAQFGTNLTTRLRNHIRNGTIFLTHNEYKDMRPNQCVYCGTDEELAKHRRQIVCVPCSSMVTRMRIDWATYARYVRRFGRPDRENQFNKRILFHLDIIWKHNKGIRFYKIARQFNKKAILRFINLKRCGRINLHLHK